jgi:hypothetical protein
MSAKESDLKIQAQVILDAIAFTPFEQCQIKAALIARAVEIDYPVEAIIEMAFT